MARKMRVMGGGLPREESIMIRARSAAHASEKSGKQRHRIERELHDTVGQELTALGLLVQSLLEKQRTENRVLSRIAQGVDRALTQVRSIMERLRLRDKGAP